MAYLLNRKAKGSNAILKIDMEKAYNQLAWSFLMYVIEWLGFSLHMSRLIDNCVESPWFSIMINETYKCYFKSTQGLI